MATNVDDIVLLTLLFSRLPDRRRAVPLVFGLVIGFTLLVLISLIGVLGQQALPSRWLALLGLLPIALGLSRWLPTGPADQASLPITAAGPSRPWAGPLAELLGMASLTLANGSDNIGVYLPLFARADRAMVAVTLLTFAAGLALLVTLAWGLTRAPGLAPLVHRYGAPLVPVVLIGLGLLILLPVVGS